MRLNFSKSGNGSRMHLNKDSNPIGFSKKCPRYVRKQDQEFEKLLKSFQKKNNKLPKPHSYPQKNLANHRNSWVDDLS